jgi:hypothetical protein
VGEIIALDGRAHSPVLREKFADWLSTPDALRDPPEQREFARQNGISAVTLWRWRQDDRFMALVRGKIRARFADRLPNVVEAMVTKAEQGDVKAAELVLRHVGQLWFFAGAEDAGEDRADLAETLIQSVTRSDFGRIALAHYRAVEAQRRAIDAEAQVVEEADEQPVSEEQEEQEDNGDEQ